jgi:hypothetical protein
MAFSKFAPLFNETCSYNKMIEFITIKKLKVLNTCQFAEGTISNRDTKISVFFVQ